MYWVEVVVKQMSHIQLNLSAPSLKSYSLSAGPPWDLPVALVPEPTNGDKAENSEYLDAIA